METIKQKFSHSVMSYITLSLVSIITVALLSIFISFWITELADKDAQAINLSGSMRMQTYHIGLALRQDQLEDARAYINALDKTWNHTLFASQRLSRERARSDALDQSFNKAFEHWNQVLKPQLLDALASATARTGFAYQLLEDQVALTDAVVTQFQLEAEAKVRRLRSFQLLALLITVAVGSLIFYLLKNRIERPLGQLTQTAHRLGQGDYSQRVDISGSDELGLLGEVFNQMSASIEQTHEALELRVAERTEELQRNNVALQFLFNTARKIIDSHQQELNYQQILDQLAEVIGADKIELCLFTAQGEKPYMHIAGAEQNPRDCSNRSCDACKGDAPFSRTDLIRISDRYPISHNDLQYGVISVQTPPQRPLDNWQEQLLNSTADQLAISLSLSAQKDQERRLAMLNERTVIARELHDSLAQALSYLQIQVTRLQKSHDQQKWALQQPIIDELREGLSSAYRQLRELLTTFRLKMDAEGLKGALENTVKQLLERSNMTIDLNYQLSDLPLSPVEEIHLLQIVREASQNAIHHSGGSRVDITLRQLPDQSIELTICDNGIGIGSSPEKLNHYGLAIMNERSRHLGGEVKIGNRAEGGVEVRFAFTPTFLREAQAS